MHNARDTQAFSEKGLALARFGYEIGSTALTVLKIGLCQGLLAGGVHTRTYCSIEECRVVSHCFMRCRHAMRVHLFKWFLEWLTVLVIYFMASEMLDTGNRSVSVGLWAAVARGMCGTSIKLYPLDTNQRLFIGALREETCLRAKPKES
jgi:hypothetical protein